MQINTENSIIKNLVYQFAYRVLTIITPLITSPYLSRVLGAKMLGVFSATYAHANYFVLLAMLGVEYYGNRTIAVCDSIEERKKQFWGIYYIQAASMVLSVGLYLFTTLSVPSGRRTYAICQGIWILAAGLDINWYFFGTQQVKITVQINTAIKILTILLTITLVNDSSSLLKYILIMACGMLINQVVIWFELFKQIKWLPPDYTSIRQHVKPMLKLFIPVVGLSIFHITDKTMVDLLSDEINSGCYYNADRLMNIPLGLITALSTVMLPKLSKEFHKKSSISNALLILKKSSELTVSLACALSFGIGAISYEFVPFFFGNEFLLCIKLILGLAPAIILKSLEEFVRAQYLIPTGKDNIYITCVFVAAGSNIIANYFFIPLYGAFGAVIGTVVAETVLLCTQLYGVRNSINFIKILSTSLIYLLFGVVMFAGIRVFATHTNFSNGITVLISIVIGGAIYFLLVVVYSLINKSSIYNNYLRRFFTCFNL